MRNKQEIILTALVNKQVVRLGGYECRLFQKGEYVNLPSGEYLVEDVPFLGIKYIQNGTEVVWLGVDWSFTTILSFIDKLTDDEVIILASQVVLSGR